MFVSCRCSRSTPSSNRRSPPCLPAYPPEPPRYLLVYNSRVSPSHSHHSPVLFRYTSQADQSSLNLPANLTLLPQVLCTHFICFIFVCLCICTKKSKANVDMFCCSDGVSRRRLQIDANFHNMNIIILLVRRKFNMD